MSRYLAARVLQGIVTLLVLITLVFILTRVIGDPVDLLLPDSATPEERDRMIHKLGLDRPFYVQYAEYIGGLLRGDVGDSLKFNRPVTELFLERFPNTVRLALVTIFIAMVLGFTMGMLSATHRGSRLDTLFRALSVIGMSAPSFWVGLMLLLVFAVWLGIFPVAKAEGPAAYVLPAFTWSLFTLAGIARLVRSSMIEALDSEYVKLARIKGASPNRVVWKHCLRNALIPVVTFAGMQMAFLFAGSVVIESIFAWPGIGRLIYQGIIGRDYPLVQGCVLIVGFIIVTMSLAVDILYAYIDPRIRYAGGRR
ncbi:MAG: ABC transporter permease [Anaerolineae bacterium]|jgi:peptide/nickel transport system permease protein